MSEISEADKLDSLNAFAESLKNEDQETLTNLFQALDPESDYGFTEREKKLVVAAVLQRVLSESAIQIHLGGLELSYDSPYAIKKPITNLMEQGAAFSGVEKILEAAFDKKLPERIVDYVKGVGESALSSTVPERQSPDTSSETKG